MASLRFRFHTSAFPGCLASSRSTRTRRKCLSPGHTPPVVVGKGGFKNIFKTMIGVIIAIVEMNSISTLPEFPHGFAARLRKAGAKRAPSGCRLGPLSSSESVVRSALAGEPPPTPVASGARPGPRQPLESFAEPEPCRFLPAVLLLLAVFLANLTFLEVI